MPHSYQIGETLTLPDIAASGIASLPFPSEELGHLIINQTTAGVSLTIVDPTVTSRRFRFLVGNSGTETFTAYGASVAPGTAVWIAYLGPGSGYTVVMDADAAVGGTPQRQVDEQCYDAPTGANVPDFNTVVTEDNGGDFAANSGAVAPSSAPMRVRNNTANDIFLTGFRIRFGATTFTGTGSIVIGGVTFVETGFEDVDGIYRTLIFGNPDNGTGFAMVPGQGFNVVIGIADISGSAFRGPVTHAGVASTYFDPGAQPVMEVTVTGSTPAIEQQVVRTFEDGTALASVEGQTTTTDVSGGIPTDWVLKDPVVDQREVDEQCYLVPTGTFTDQTLNNFEAPPVFGPTGTSQTFFTYPQVFFDPAQLPDGARLKRVRMFDQRLGNNTMSISMRYGAGVTNSVSVSNHPNGASPAPIEYTFPTGIDITATDFLQANGTNNANIGQGAQGRVDEGAGLGSPWIASITPGVATPSGGPEPAYNVSGFNAEIDIEVPDKEVWITRTFEDGTVYASRPGETTFTDVTAGIPADWELQATLKDRVTDLEAAQSNVQTLDVSAAVDLGAYVEGEVRILNIVDNSAGSITSSDTVRGDADITNYAVEDQILAVAETVFEGGLMTFTQADGAGGTTPAVFIPGVLGLARGTSGPMTNSEGGALEFWNDANPSWQTMQNAYNGAIGDNILTPAYQGARVRPAGDATNEVDIEFLSWQSGGGGGFSVTADIPLTTSPGWRLHKLPGQDARGFQEDAGAAAMATVLEPTLPAGTAAWVDGDLVRVQALDGAVLFTREGDQWSRTEIKSTLNFLDHDDAGDPRFDFANGDVAALRTSDGQWIPARNPGGVGGFDVVDVLGTDLSAWAQFGTLNVTDSGQYAPNGAKLYDFQSPNEGWIGELVDINPSADFPEGLREGLAYRLTMYVEKAASDIGRFSINMKHDGDFSNESSPINIFSFDPFTGSIEAEFESGTQSQVGVIDANTDAPFSGRDSVGAMFDAGDFWRIEVHHLRNNALIAHGIQIRARDYDNNGGATVTTPNTNTLRLSAPRLDYKAVIGSSSTSIVGVRDDGTERIMRGRGLTPPSGSLVVSFPAAFRDDNDYSLVLTPANGTAVSMTYDADSPTGFTARSFDSSGAPLGTSFSWVAMGSKP